MYTSFVSDLLIYGSCCCSDAVVRGHRSGLLTTADYNNLCQCETLDDIKLNLVRIRLPSCNRLRACQTLILNTCSHTLYLSLLGVCIFNQSTGRCNV